jgi:hypothetical protein
VVWFKEDEEEDIMIHSDDMLSHTSLASIHTVIYPPVLCVEWVTGREHITWE